MNIKKKIYENLIKNKINKNNFEKYQSSYKDISLYKNLKNKKILLIIGGSIASYKSLYLIRLLKEKGAQVQVVMTKSAQDFITPLAVASLSGMSVFTDSWKEKNEKDVIHIRLARESDIIILAPCTANRIAKMASGYAEDLSGIILLASHHTPKILAPSMNFSMWSHPSTQRNVKQLIRDGIYFVGPNVGKMAEKNEYGKGRMSEPIIIAKKVENLLLKTSYLPLLKKNILVTSGPTREPLDPIRYFSNRSSGKQGYAIAKALKNLGGSVTLITGPVSLKDPFGIKTIHIETSQEMYSSVFQLLPVDVAIFVAAVSDWRPAVIESQKIKKKNISEDFQIKMLKNIDILYEVSHSKNRPKLVIGFSSETSNLLKNSQEKLKRKCADWIIANDVSKKINNQSIFDGNYNEVSIISKNSIERWKKMNKNAIAEKLAIKIIDFLKIKKNF